MITGQDPSRFDVEGADGWMTAVQVAEALGIKRATVYAYVSRGILHRRLALDGRTSLFDTREVEDLRQGRGSATGGELRTVLATSITRVSEGSLIVRGHDLVQLVADGAGFESVADLIWQSDNAAVWSADRDAPEGRLAWPSDPAAGVPVLDRFRVAVAQAAAADGLRGDLSPSVVRRTGPRIIAAMIESLPPRGQRRTGGVPETATMPTADLLWPRLTRAAPTVERIRALDIAMALLADHGLASSTFAVRVAASVRADPYAVVGAGLGALDGPWHGAASAGVHRALAAKAAGQHPLDRPATPSSAVGLPGFGHSIYRATDPRFGILRDAVAQAWPDDPRRPVVDDYQQAFSTRTEGVANVDLALGYLTFMAGMDADAGEAIFAVSRCAGWLGHAMEEYQERPLRLRPKGHYVGPLSAHDRA